MDIGVFVAERVCALNYGGEATIRAMGFPKRLMALNTTSYALSVACNLVCTVMIGYRAW